MLCAWPWLTQNISKKLFSILGCALTTCPPLPLCNWLLLGVIELIFNFPIIFTFMMDRWQKRTIYAAHMYVIVMMWLRRVDAFEVLKHDGTGRQWEVVKDCSSSQCIIPHMNSATPFMTYQILHVLALRCHPQGVITTKVLTPMCQSMVCSSLWEWLKF